MSKSVQTCTVRILNEEYVLRSDESAEHIQHAAGMVDAMMRELAAKASSAEHKKVAVLTAVSMASTVHHLQEQLRMLDEQHTKLIALIDRAQ